MEKAAKEVEAKFDYASSETKFFYAGIPYDTRQEAESAAMVECQHRLLVMAQDAMRTPEVDLPVREQRGFREALKRIAERPHQRQREHFAQRNAAKNDAGLLAQSTPPEQRAEEVWSALCPSCNKWSAQLICEHCGSDNTNKAMKFRSAHPEAVRMPIELRDLSDLSDEDRKFGKEMALATKYFYSKLELVAANLHAERSAHERTRAELERLRMEAKDAAEK